MILQYIYCCQDTVFSGDFIAKELDTIGDKGSGDTTVVDV
jgi:hypothetical protein